MKYIIYIIILVMLGAAAVSLMEKPKQRTVEINFEPRDDYMINLTDEEWFIGGNMSKYIEK